jgi:hypothetical protein
VGIKVYMGSALDDKRPGWGVWCCLQVRLSVSPPSQQRGQRNPHDVRAGKPRRYSSFLNVITGALSGTSRSGGRSPQELLAKLLIRDPVCVAPFEPSLFQVSQVQHTRNISESSLFGKKSIRVVPVTNNNSQ